MESSEVQEQAVTNGVQQKHIICDPRHHSPKEAQALEEATDTKL